MSHSSESIRETERQIDAMLTAHHDAVALSRSDPLATGDAVRIHDVSPRDGRPYQDHGKVGRVHYCYSNAYYLILFDEERHAATFRRDQLEKA